MGKFVYLDRCESIGETVCVSLDNIAYTTDFHKGVCEITFIGGNTLLVYSSAADLESVSNGELYLINNTFRPSEWCTIEARAEAREQKQEGNNNV